MAARQQIAARHWHASDGRLWSEDTAIANDNEGGASDDHEGKLKR
jgi:hypothetical protein